jgi:hypothetical protein
MVWLPQWFECVSASKTKEQLVGLMPFNPIPGRRRKKVVEVQMRTLCDIGMICCEPVVGMFYPTGIRKTVVNGGTSPFRFLGLASLPKNHALPM